MDSILLVSDVHADAAALGEILRLAFSGDFTRRYGPVMTVVSLGDVVGRGMHPAEAMSLFRGLKNLKPVMGDNDEAFIRGGHIKGSSPESEEAHRVYREAGGYERLFGDSTSYYLDRELELYGAHGGPIDPVAVTPAHADEEETLLHSRPFQHISGYGVRYFDADGYHYLPSEAFEAVRPVFGRSGHVIVCGHEHEEAAYRRRLKVEENVLPLMKNRTVRVDGTVLEEKKLRIQDDCEYLVRLGLAGPAGYGLSKSGFGVLSVQDGARTMYLLGFSPKGI
jgi:predicted phosphodiesterase